MKKYKKTIILLGILISINIIQQFFDVNQYNANKTISSYLHKQEIDVEAGKAKTLSFEHLDNSRVGMFINEYSLVREDRYRANGEHEMEIYPVRFRIISFLGFYKVISSSSPSDGQKDSELYKKIFPISVINKLDENYEEYISKLTEQSKVKYDEVKNSLKSY